MAMCAELVDLAMRVGRLAAAQAKTELSQPAPEPTQAAEPIPEAANPPAIQPTEPAPPRTAAPTRRAPSCKPFSPARLFISCAAIVRACIALYHRLANFTAAKHPTAAAAAPRQADPIRANEKRAENPTEIAPHLLAETCNELESTINLSSAPDQSLDAEIARISDIKELIRLCATSPPTLKT